MLNKNEFIKKYFHYTEPRMVNWVEEFDLELDKTVVMIPARSGSSRIKDKNIRDICGKPLFAYTAEIAQRLDGVDRVIINTDSTKYADLAEKHGVEAPFIRPSELAGTSKAIFWSFFYTLRFFMEERYPIKTLITLLPTNPFRNLGSVQSLVDLTKKCGFVQSYFTPRVDGENTLFLGDSGWHGLEFRFDSGEVRPMKALGHFNGVNVIPHWYRTEDKYHAVTNPYELIDIDTHADLELAQYVIESNLYDFGVASC